MKWVDAIARTVLAGALLALFAYVVYIQLQILTGEHKINGDALRIYDFTAGALLSGVATVIGYFFGSSSGSNQKTEAFLPKDEKPKKP